MPYLILFFSISWGFGSSSRLEILHPASVTNTHPWAWLPQPGLCSSDWGWYSPMRMIATNRSVQLWLRLTLTHEHDCHKQVCTALAEADTHPWDWLPQPGLCSSDWGWYSPMNMNVTNRSVQLWLRLILTHEHDCHKQVCTALAEADTHPWAWLPQTSLCRSNWGWYSPMSMISTNRSVQLSLRLILTHGTNRSVQHWLRLILTHQHDCHKQVCTALTDDEHVGDLFPHPGHAEDHDNHKQVPWNTNTLNFSTTTVNWTSFFLIDIDCTCWQLLLIPLPFYHSVFTIVIYRW